MFIILFYKLFFFIYKIVFKFNSVNYGDVIYIYDIDNTICNTGYRSNYQGFLDKDLVNNLEVYTSKKIKYLISISVKQYFSLQFDQLNFGC